MTEISRGAWYQQVNVDIMPISPQEWRVVITARIRASDRAIEGPLALDLAYCPLILEQVTSSSTRIAVERYATTRGSLLLQLTLGSDAKVTWDGLPITIEMRWTPSKSVLHGLETDDNLGLVAPCLVLPDMLPNIVALEDLLGSSQDAVMPRVSLDAELPNGLMIGGIEAPDHAGWLQLIVVPDNDCMIEVDRRLTLIAPDVSNAGLRSARDAVSSIQEFLFDDLGRSPIHHCVWIADPTSKSYYVSTGAYSHMPVRWAHIVDPRKGNDISIARTLAHGWIGGGTRVWGEDAVAISTALNSARGLRWAEAMGDPGELARVISNYELLADDAYGCESRTIGNISAAMAIALYHGIRDRATHNGVVRTTQDHWGMFLPEQVLVDVLSAFGVKLPYLLT